MVSVIRNITLFARLRFDADTADESRGRFLAKMEEELTALENDLRFFELEWAALEDEQAEAVLEAPELERYANFLRSQRRFRPHLLSEPEERVSAEKSISGITAGDGSTPTCSRRSASSTTARTSRSTRRATGCA